MHATGSCRASEEALAEIGPPGRRRSWTRRTALPEDTGRFQLNARQRLLSLDTWRRSGLSAEDSGAVVGISKHSLFA